MKAIGTPGAAETAAATTAVEPSTAGDAKKVAHDFEQFFMGYLMKTMQKSSSSSQSFEGGVYQDMFTEQIADQAAQSTPLGLGAMIEKALTQGGSAAATAPPSHTATDEAGKVTSGYGMRLHPISGEMQFHHGMDLAAPEGTPVSAASAGKVTFSGTKSGFGEVVEVTTAATGSAATQIYAHLSQRAVSIGQTIAAGDKVGEVGQTGAATGPHLHFEVREGGRSVDPHAWVAGLNFGQKRPK